MWEFAMIRRHRSGMVLAGIVLTLLTLGSATPAFAVTMPLPLPPGGPQAAAHHGAAATQIIAASGTPAWQITLIAIAAALVTATAAVLLDRARAARRQLPVPHPEQEQPAVPHYQQRV
jgi:hypothetical protein